VPGAQEFSGDFESDPGPEESTFTVDVEGFEGPLDLLLELARRQKVDLTRISVLALAEQYLLFVEAARKLRLELAADYLVMAAWLAFLKSRLLLPAPARAAEPDAGELAEALAQRLRKLEAIRRVAALLMDRPRLGRDFFARGAPEAVEIAQRSVYHANLYDLLAAYARQAQKHARARIRFKAREVWSLADAREALARLIGGSRDWAAFDDWLLEACLDPGMRRSARASSFSASLELVREGRIELRQDKAFAPIFIRAAANPPAEGAAA
jgi:segregation and condensation protein A